MICDVGNRKARILEEPCSADETRHCEILLRRRKIRAIEPAHQGTRIDAEGTRELPHCGDVRTGRKDAFEESPALRLRSSQIDRELRERLSLNVFTAAGEQQAAQLIPARRFANVHKLR